MSDLGRSAPRERRGTPEKEKLPAKAVYDFKAQTSKELSFKKGDTVYILRKIDQNWYEGEHHGRVGIFPISYVEVSPFLSLFRGCCFPSHHRSRINNSFPS